MKLHELTQEQRDVAEENHSLIYAFLNKKKLSTDNFYDVIVFGYLQAVQKYSLREDLKQKYAFSTIAWRAMERSLGDYYRAQSRPSRKAITVSLDTLVNILDCFTRVDDIYDADYMDNKMDSEQLWNKACKLLTKDQVRVIKMRACGYSNREIAVKQKRQYKEIDLIFTEIQSALMDLCLV